MDNHRKIFFVVAIVAILLSIFAFRSLTSLFYLSDEFLQLGFIHYYGMSAGLFSMDPFQILIGHNRFLGTCVTNIFLKMFEYNTVPITVFLYILHACNILLVGALAYRLTRKLYISSVTMVLFALPTTAQQSLSWLAAGIQTLGGQVFILLSILVGVIGLQKHKTSFVIGSWVLAYIAQLFKPSNIFVFLLLLFLPWIVHLRTLDKRKLFLVFGVGLPVLLALMLAFVFSVFGSQIASHSFLLVIVRTAWNSLYYPLLSFGQFFIPFRFIARAGTVLLPIMYRNTSGMSNAQYIGSVIVGDNISTVISFVGIVLLSAVYFSDKKYRKWMDLPIVFYFFSFLPIAYYLTDREASGVESRYLYVPYFAVSYLIAIYADWISGLIHRVIRIRWISYGIPILFLCLYLGKQTVVINREIRNFVFQGNDIKLTMEQLKKSVPSLPDNPVFYITSDRDYFYPNNKLPFQLGTGYMIMLTLDLYPQIPQKLVGERKLSNYFQQGYLESDGRHFGYYWDMETLRAAVRTYSILPEQLIGLYFHSKENRFENITTSVQENIFNP